MPTHTVVGVCIDHAQARIVTLDENDIATVRAMQSQVPPAHKDLHEGHPRHGGSSTLGVGGHNHDERFRLQEIKRFYDAVAASLATPDRLFILGHNGAITEFEAHLRDHTALTPRLAGSETINRLTDAQLIARVRELAGRPPARRKVNDHRA